MKKLNFQKVVFLRIDNGTYEKLLLEAGDKKFIPKLIREKILISDNSKLNECVFLN